MPERIRGFEPVIEKKRKGNGGYILPRRKTVNSCASDLYTTECFVIYPGEKVSIFTNIKAYMLDDEVLISNVRSSMGIDFDIGMPHEQGWIDSDYYSNIGNDGNIIACLKNYGTQPYIINPGDRIGQVMFQKYLRPDNDTTTEKRVGGVGST